MRANSHHPRVREPVDARSAAIREAGEVADLARHERTSRAGDTPGP